MRLVEMECENCGANLKVDEKNNTIHCPYCGATYKIDEEKKENMEDSGYEFEKGRIKAQNERIQSSFKNIQSKRIIFTIIPIMVFCIAFFGIFGMVLTFNNSFFRISEMSDYKANSFNNKFEIYSGTQPKLSVDSLLDTVSTNNKNTKNRTIKVTYNDVSEDDSDEILNIKDLLDSSKKYKIKLEYDKQGYVDEIIIKD